MKTPPLVSIIIPAYNRAHLIGETLDSVIAQTYPNWECIVVDDHSTDNTWEVVEAYCRKDARIKLLRRPEDKPKGANACRNHGIKMSIGEFINFLDSDDLIHPNTLDIKVKNALLYKADIIISRHIFHNCTFAPEITNTTTFESNQFDIEYILSKKLILTGDAMVRSSKIESLEFDENLHKAQEYDFFVRLFRNKLKYCFVDSILHFHRTTDDSISQKTADGNPTQINSLIYLYKKKLNHYSDEPLVIEETKRKIKKMYKNLIRKNRIGYILKNFSFFKSAFSIDWVLFSFFFTIHVLTKRGFDHMK